jgi:hypothetical protein
MRRRAPADLAVALTLGLALLAGAADKKKPSLRLRVMPRVGLPGQPVHFTADLVGGEDVLGLYCLTAVWDFGDESTSTQEGECPPFEPGRTKIERHFVTEHVYAERSAPRVSVTLKKGDKVLLVARESVTLGERPGRGLTLTASPGPESPR